MRRKKSGFTIVELVIVIAVIAILSAILVPIISDVIGNAQVAKDTQLVHDLNTALAMDTSTDGHATMHSALQAVAKNGYDVGKITAQASDNRILWDSVNDVFCYLSVAKGGAQSLVYIPELTQGDPLSVGDYRLWVISDRVDETYSTYYIGNATTINTTKGFDVGAVEGITEINYVGGASARDVIIRTDSTTTELNIDAPLDTVRHYGRVGSLHVTAVAEESYHENGEVTLAEIAEGRLVLERGSRVAHVHLIATDGAFNDIVIAKDKSVSMPIFSRDAAEIAVTGIKNFALADGVEADAVVYYIWLTGVGLYEQVAVSLSNDPAEATGAAESDNDIFRQIAAQIANDIVFSVADERYRVTATYDGSSWSYSVTTGAGAATNYTAEVNETTIVVRDALDQIVQTDVREGLDEATQRVVLYGAVEDNGEPTEEPAVDDGTIYADLVLFLGVDDEGEYNFDPDGLCGGCGWEWQYDDGVKSGTFTDDDFEGHVVGCEYDRLGTATLYFYPAETGVATVTFTSYPGGELRRVVLTVSIVSE